MNDLAEKMSDILRGRIRNSARENATDKFRTAGGRARRNQRTMVAEIAKISRCRGVRWNSTTWNSDELEICSRIDLESIPIPVG